MPDTSQISGRIQIRILPSEDEDDDMETLSLVGDVRSDFLAEISLFKTYTVEQVSDYTREWGLFVLAMKAARAIIKQKDLVIQLFQTSQTAIDVLSKQRHVKTIEMTIDGNNIHIEDASDAQVDRLIDIFEAQHPGKVQQITSSSTVEITGIVSKVEQPVIPERTASKEEE